MLPSASGAGRISSSQPTVFFPPRPSAGDPSETHPPAQSGKTEQVGRTGQARPFPTTLPVLLPAVLARPEQETNTAKRFETRGLAAGKGDKDRTRRRGSGRGLREGQAKAKGQDPDSLRSPFSRFCFVEP